MTEELSISNTIKIILGILVIVAVIAGVYLIFRNSIIDFFKNLPGGTEKIVLSLIGN